jgi:hypothetical protein
MAILEAIGVLELEAFDASRALEVEEISLSADAASEIAKLVDDPDLLCGSLVKVIPTENVVDTPFYWEITRNGRSLGEAFCIPKGPNSGLPTAIELAIIKALHVSTKDDWASLKAGGDLIIVGDTSELERISDALKIARKPCCGESIFWGNSGTINLTDDSDKYLTKSVISCFRTSLECSPIKFRFLELYRSIENRFLEDILKKINLKFRSEPKQALDEALIAVKSELNQLSLLAEQHKSPFEDLRDIVAGMTKTNTFAESIARKLEDKGSFYKSPKYKAGAAMMYYVRCAIVHAGEKDLIFESFDDGVELVDAIISCSESAALTIAGVGIT